MNRFKFVYKSQLTRHSFRTCNRLMSTAKAQCVRRVYQSNQLDAVYMEKKQMSLRRLRKTVNVDTEVMSYSGLLER